MTTASSAIVSGESCARDVALVAFVDLGERLFVGADAAFCLVFGETPAGTGFGLCGEEELDVGVRENDAADVAALEHAAFRSRLADLPLMLDHDPADLGDRRNDRRAWATSSVRISAETSSPSRMTFRVVGFADEFDLGILGDLGDLGLVVEIDVRIA